MILDSQLNFVPIGGNLSLVSAPGDIVSTNVIDLLGVGVGVAPPGIIGNVSVFGLDPGIGGERVEINAIIGTAVVSAGGGTLNAKLQYAADPGAASNYTPAAGDWKTVVETGSMTAAQLAAQTIFARFPWLPAFPANLRPRFIRMLFTVETAAFTAGTVAAALVTPVRDDQANKYAANNFVVA